MTRSDTSNGVARLNADFRSRIHRGRLRARRCRSERRSPPPELLGRHDPGVPTMAPASVSPAQVAVSGPSLWTAVSAIRAIPKSSTFIWPRDVIITF